VTRNLWHSCVRVRARDHLEKQTPQIRALYRELLATVREIGPVHVDATKGGIAFQVRARSIGVGFHRDWLEVFLWLKGNVDPPGARRVEDFGPLGKGYHFALRSRGDIDARMRRLLRQAYAIGAQAAPTRGRVNRISVP
jgi:hypothetical protein